MRQRPPAAPPRHDRDTSLPARRSRVLAGNVAEGGTLQAMLTALDAPPEAVVVLDRGLATEGNVAWLRERGHRCLAGQQRVFRQADGRMLHVRKATQAESWQRAIHERLGVDASPGGVRKLVVQPRRRKKNARNAVPHT